jgi:hypothetical protein
MFLVHSTTPCLNQIRIAIERHRKRAVELLAEERDELARKAEAKMRLVEQREKDLLRIRTVLLAVSAETSG